MFPDNIRNGAGKTIDFATRGLKSTRNRKSFFLAFCVSSLKNRSHVFSFVFSAGLIKCGM